MCSLHCKSLNVVNKVAVNVKLLKEEYQRLIIIEKVFMCYKTKLKLIRLSRDCVFKTTCALTTYQTGLIKLFF